VQLRTAGNEVIVVAEEYPLLEAVAREQLMTKVGWKKT
jgi:hypothetical protein